LATNNGIGGYLKVRKEGINADYLPIWLQNAGYNTYYAGKMWNAYGTKSMPPDPAAGWTGSEILLDPWTYRYYQPAFSRDGGDVKHYNGQYSPDVVAHKAAAYLEEALESDKPWFLVAAPVAPHNQVAHKPVKHPVPPPSAARHEHLFKDFQIPRTPNFNPGQVRIQLLNSLSID
jgi:N-acetylglucosamine-6-sulfatase